MSVQDFGHDMLRERTLHHQQVYQYKVHRAKLQLLGNMLPPAVAAKVGAYLLRVLMEDFPDALFQDIPPTANVDGQAPDENSPDQLPARLRSSQARFDTLPLLRREKQNLANDLADLGLLLARRNRDRHPAVQDFMLANDSCTIACEVPVYLAAEELAYYKSRGFAVSVPELSKPITGHIDVLQARNGFIHLLDYKPEARSIQPTSQLVLYALAFASRTRLPVRALKCAWFDEKDYFEFFPLEAVRAKGNF